MTVNVNQEGYERRLAVVSDLLLSRGFQTSSISAMAYTETWPYPYNNYLFHVELATPATSALLPGTQPGTTEAPTKGVSSIVIKLSNPAAGMNSTNRVENDVAVQHLVRQSMTAVGLPSLVPDVYAWEPAKTINPLEERSFGWIMSELREGVDLDQEFSTLDVRDKKQVLGQIAEVLAAIQTAKLPENIKYGGLTFDSNGRIATGESPLREGAPFDSYLELRLARLYKTLELAQKSPVIQGWERNNLNTRIKQFLTSGGVEKLLAETDLFQKTLIHSDLTTNNILFDKKTKKITAILDFDWTSVSHSLEEFTTSFSDLAGNIKNEDERIVRAFLKGDFTNQDPLLDEESTKQWELAKLWNSAMEKSNVISPSNIKGADKILDLLKLQSLLCPFQLSSESALSQISDEKKVELRAKAEASLEQWLDNHGY